MGRSALGEEKVSKDTGKDEEEGPGEKNLRSKVNK